MRHLLQPRILKQAAIAALISTVACYPRMSLWLTRPGPVWYLEAMFFFCGIVLWGFVFAWHTPYTGKPVFVFKLETRLFTTVTLIGTIVAAVYHLWLDPTLRMKMPQEYPADLDHWLAFVLFSLTFNQLFLTFAPCDWLMRLLKRRWLAISLTTAFGVCVLVLNLQALAPDISPRLQAELVVGRIAIGFLAVTFYLRGGVLLVSWWTLLLESRHLLYLVG